MNSQYNGGYPGCGAPLPPQKQPFIKRFFHSPEYAVRKEIFITACIIGFAFIAYPVCSRLISEILTAFPSLYNKYISELTFSYFFEAMYTFVCVGLPMLLVYGILKATGRFYGEISFGAPYESKNTVLLILSSIGVCFIGNLVTSYITSFFQSNGMEFYSYDTLLEGEQVTGDVSGIFAFVLRTAIVPAFVEEFAFRGVILQSLRKYGDRFAIAVSAIMFGLMHANMTQVPFALIAGIALGYSYVVTGSLWTTVLIHFLNNFVSVVYTVLGSCVSESAAIVFSLAVSYGFIAIGLAALAYYIYRNPCWNRLSNGAYGIQKKKIPAFFLAPTVVIGAYVLIGYMVADIYFK